MKTSRGIPVVLKYVAQYLDHDVDIQMHTGDETAWNLTHILQHLYRQKNDDKSKQGNLNKMELILSMLVLLLWYCCHWGKLEKVYRQCLLFLTTSCESTNFLVKSLVQTILSSVLTIPNLLYFHSRNRAFVGDIPIDVHCGVAPNTKQVFVPIFTGLLRFFQIHYL